MKKIILLLIVITLFSCEENEIKLNVLEGSWYVDFVNWGEICDEVSTSSNIITYEHPYIEFNKDGTGINWPTPAYLTAMNKNRFIPFTWEFHEEKFLVIKRSDGKELTAVVNDVYEYDDEINFDLFWVEIETDSPYSNGKDVMLRVTMNLTRNK